MIEEIKAAMQFTLEMDEKNDQGISNRDSLYQVMNSTPEDSKPYQQALKQIEDEPRIPDCALHVWEWFWELHSSRSSNMNGPEPLYFREIEAWNCMKQMEIGPIEIDILKQLDMTYINHVNSKLRKEMNKNKKKGKK